MNNPTPNILRRCAGGRADRRGSAIILVLVSMVLMAILAGSLLQLARFERIPRSESNIEIVIESVVAEILNQVTDDLLDDTGNFLNTGNVAGGGDEPWDFPWTNDTITNVRRPVNSNGTTLTTVLGGSMDDTWLAAHMPDFGAAPAAGTVYAGGVAGTGNGVWRKITSLTGLYLGSNGAGNSDLSQTAIPTEFAVTNLATATNSDTNIATGSVTLVDADGDGIGDSRWEWAPLRQIGATQYVMAVRIIDLSARMDMNVSTGRFNQTAASLARGDSPVEMNGQEYVQDAGPAAGTAASTASSEWLSVLNFRMTSTATPGAITPIGSAEETRYDNNNANPTVESRRHLWTDGLSRVSNTFNFNGENPASAYDYQNNTFGLTDAFELLQGNGVNSANTTTVENLMPNFLRRGGQENNYAIGNVNGWTQQQFWFNDPRKHVSMFTGSSVAAKPAALAQDRELKIDVNEAVKTATGRTALRNRIDTFLNSNGGALVSLYPHLDQDGLADQLTANIADYIDDDNTVTIVGDKTGFEALPHITEVYTQRVYDGAVAVTADAAINQVTWTPAGAQGYALEIANPLARYDGGAWIGRPISLDNVWLRFNGGAAVELSTLTGDTELLPGEVIYLYRNSVGNDPADDDLDTASAYYTAVTAGNVYSNVIAAEGPVMPTNPGSITVSLHATQQGGTGAAAWAYNACAIQVGGANPPVESVPAADFTVATPYQTYIQTHYQGVGQGIRMMTVAANPASTNGYDETVGSLNAPSNNTTTGAIDTGNAIRPVIGEFANQTKTNAPTGFASLNNQQIVWPDSQRKRMHWVGDILQIPLIGPDRNAAGNATTLAKAFADANADTTGMNGLYLPYKAGTPVLNGTAGSGAFNYPQALMLLEQLTTFNPATDGEDGDGQADSGTESFTNPDLDEVMVPGKLNLNTAPRETLIRLLPFPDLATRQNVANAIITRRESMRQSTNFGTGADNIPAVAYTTALYEQIESLGVNPSRLGGDTYEIGSPLSRIDLNDHETALGTYVSADGVANDREEELMLAKWLTEMTDTRSDVFAAYIVVQGYPAGNFAAGADESARLIVIFSRANVEGQGDKAVEIGRFRIN